MAIDVEMILPVTRAYLSYWSTELKLVISIFRRRSYQPTPTVIQRMRRSAGYICYNCYNVDRPQGQKKNMTLAHASRTVALLSHSKKYAAVTRMWEEVGQLERVAEIRADVAQPILQQSESMDRRPGQIKKVSSMANFLIMST